MVVVCFNESLISRMSSANLRLERFVLGSCPASLTSVVTSLPLSCQWFRDVLCGVSASFLARGGSVCFRRRCVRLLFVGRGVS